MANAKSKVSIGLINPKSASNVAVVLRAAGCFSVDSILYTGTRYTKAKAFVEDTKNMHQRISSTSVEDILEASPEGSKIVAIELVEGALALPKFSHPDNAYYIFGPEDGSIPQSIVSKCDHVVYIPTATSLNLAVTANIVLYDRLSKSDFEDSDACIRASRDTNNNTKITQ